MTVSIRAYRPTDHNVCRGLWAELTELQRNLYDDPDLGGPDPGAGFEDYLTRLDLSGMWVADDPEDGVVGLVGLILNGRTGEVYPVVVAQRHRSKGIGTALLAHVAEQARGRALRQLMIVPESRNITAHGAGYNTLASVRLTLDLTDRARAARESSRESDELDLHDLRFHF
jgi:GNAT superfamily N-acetyltransferase